MTEGRNQTSHQIVHEVAGQKWSFRRKRRNQSHPQNLTTPPKSLPHQETLRSYSRLPMSLCPLTAVQPSTLSLFSTWTSPDLPTVVAELNFNLWRMRTKMALSMHFSQHHSEALNWF